MVNECFFLKERKKPYCYNGFLIGLKTFIMESALENKKHICIFRGLLCITQASEGAPKS